MGTDRMAVWGRAAEKGFHALAAVREKTTVLNQVKSVLHLGQRPVKYRKKRCNCTAD